MPLTGKQVRSLARDIVLANPGGVRWTAIVDKIRKEHPKTPYGTITGNLNLLVDAHPDHVKKIERGLYVPVGPQNPPAKQSEPAKVGGNAGKSKLPPEGAFYSPFADFLRGELGEVTEAVTLGGSALGGKWGTPDVVGVYRPTAGDLIKFQVEIISAEIKMG